MKKNPRKISSPEGWSTDNIHGQKINTERKKLEEFQTIPGNKIRKEKKKRVSEEIDSEKNESCFSLTIFGFFTIYIYITV